MVEPIIDIINNAQGQFLVQTGHPAETLHASPAFEKALHRWAYKQPHLLQHINNRTKYDQAEICGLGIVRMTKPSPHVEFYLSAEVGGQRHTLRVMMEPEDVRLRKGTGEAIELGGIEDDLPGDMAVHVRSES